MLFDIVLVAATLGCALVSGLLLGFAVVAMPGIATLDDRAFLRAFQVMDRVIQDRSPVFMLVWVGSVVSVLAALALGWGELDGGRRLLLLAAGAAWLVGVQAPTAAVNIPLNDAVQAVDLTVVDGAEARAARTRFEARWNRWNAIRTGIGALASVGLLGLLAVI